jgi:rare lipoprotein A
MMIGCSSSNGRYQQRHDSTPARLPQAHELKNAIPRAEPKSRGGNKNYSVLGKNYQVLKSAENFHQTGIASYYGKKFHGHLTSNGEIYNMYDMSAAHKTLPLPTYVKVTNLANNKSVIVRVNDRGPFHHNRIIDLSYSAAYKLDMLKTGTAKVKVESIDYLNSQQTKTAANQQAFNVVPTNFSDENKNFIQVLATKSLQKAKNTAAALRTVYEKPVTFLAQDGIFRVKIGPIASETEIQQLLEQLRKDGYPQAFPSNNNSVIH